MDRRVLGRWQEGGTPGGSRAWQEQGWGLRVTVCGWCGCEHCCLAVLSGRNPTGWSGLGPEGSPASDEVGACWVGSGGLQNHCKMVTAAMKLKDACSLEEKL